jgi:plasmid maintenance system antidote protein VapI
MDAIKPPGDILRSVLEERDLTQAAVAKAAGLPPNKVWCVAKGLHKVSAEVAIGFEKALLGAAEDWVIRQALYDLAQARKRCA